VRPVVTTSSDRLQASASIEITKQKAEEEDWDRGGQLVASGTHVNPIRRILFV
jgi:hypothetical protein